VKELKEDMYLIYKTYFKDSGIAIKDWTNFLGNKKESFTVKLFLAKDESEAINRLMDNDMFSISFNIEKLSDNNYFIEAYQKSYVLIPDNQYMYYSRKNLPFRRNSGDRDKILKTFEKFVKTLKNGVIEDYNNNNIHDNFIELVKNKLDL